MTRSGVSTRCPQFSALQDGGHPPFPEHELCLCKRVLGTPDLLTRRGAKEWGGGWGDGREAIVARGARVSGGRVPALSEDPFFSISFSEVSLR